MKSHHNNIDENDENIDELNDYQKFARKLVENGDTDEFEKKLDDYYKNVALQEIPPISPSNNLDQLLETDFILGECHSQPSPKNFLIKILPYLKKAGFTTIFIEHLYYDDQPYLDDYPEKANIKK